MSDTRPALAAVLSALTDTAITRPVSIRWAEGVYHSPQGGDVPSVCPLAPWRTIDGARDLRTGTETAAPRLLTPIDSLEILTERGLWPWQPGDPTAPRWWCEACGGRGTVGGGWAGTEPQDTDTCATCGRDDLDATGGVTADGATDDPPSLSALVAVASLGATRLRTVAAVVAELRRVTRVDGAATLGDRVVWRVLPREALAAHHRRHGHAEGDIAASFSNEFAFREACEVGGAGVGQLPPWAVEAPGYRDDVRAAWPALRALALDCGVHLLAADARRVVIGVEAL